MLKIGRKLLKNNKKAITRGKYYKDLMLVKSQG